MELLALVGKARFPNGRGNGISQIGLMRGGARGKMGAKAGAGIGVGRQEFRDRRRTSFMSSTG